MGSRIGIHTAIFTLLISFCAAVAGVVNGLLGTGGGIILTLMFRHLTSSPKDAYVSAMATVLPISIISLLTYGDAAQLNGLHVITLVLPAAGGGLLGAVLSAKAKPVTLEVLFSLLVLYSGIRMIIM